MKVMYTCLDGGKVALIRCVIAILHTEIIDMTIKFARAGLLGFISLSFSGVLLAENAPILERNQLAIGGGISLNSVGHSVDDEAGFQLFAAYALPTVNVLQYVNSSVELGYMDYGFDGKNAFDSKNSDGLWANFVLDGSIESDWGWLARLGLDLGDDSGLMVGAGASYALNPKLSLRVEYVVRDDIDSLQLNILHRF